MQKIINRLKIVHDFLARESFYALVFASVLACAILAGRLYLTKTWLYLFLGWNLFLAWVPYLCSVVVTVIYRYQPKNLWLLLPPAALWLLFFPNAPYIITDLVHLNRRWEFPLWYDVGLIATFAWIGCFLAVASLYLMQRVVDSIAGRVASWLFVLTSIMLGGVGIYLGRFLRWNSWDILYSPGTIIADVVAPLLNPANNLQAIGVTMMFSAFLFICYLTFTAGQNGPSSKAQQAPKPEAEPLLTEEFAWVEQQPFNPADALLALTPATPRNGQLKASPVDTKRKSTENKGQRKHGAAHSDVEWVFDWG